MELSGDLARDKNIGRKVFNFSLLHVIKSLENFLTLPKLLFFSYDYGTCSLTSVSCPSLLALSRTTVSKRLLLNHWNLLLHGDISGLLIQCRENSKFLLSLVLRNPTFFIKSLKLVFTTDPWPARPLQPVPQNPEGHSQHQRQRFRGGFVRISQFGNLDCWFASIFWHLH